MKIKHLLIPLLLAGSPVGSLAQGAEDGESVARAEREAGSADFWDVVREKPEYLWDLLRQKIEQYTPKKELSATTAAGGVRGAQVSADDLYWKDEHVSKVIAEDEYAAFDRALGRAQSGDQVAARAAFESFIAGYPDSELRPEAEQALEYLSGNNP
jgi:TolA-binding protein